MYGSSSSCHLQLQQRLPRHVTMPSANILCLRSHHHHCTQYSQKYMECLSQMGEKSIVTSSTVSQLKSGGHLGDCSSRSSSDIFRRTHGNTQPYPAVCVTSTVCIRSTRCRVASTSMICAKHTGWHSSRHSSNSCKRTSIARTRKDSRLKAGTIYSSHISSSSSRLTCCCTSDNIASGLGGVAGGGGNKHGSGGGGSHGSNDNNSEASSNHPKFPLWYSVWMWCTALVYLAWRWQWRRSRRLAAEQFEREQQVEQQLQQDWQTFAQRYQPRSTRREDVND